MRGRIVCLLSVLTVLLQAGEPAARGYTEGQAVRFDLYHGYLMVGRGSVGSLKGLNFLVDTGASPAVLDRRVAQKLNLEELPASIAVLEGSVQAGQTVVPSLDFGPMHRDNFPVLVEDLSFFQKALPIPIDAVIGLDVLGESSFAIDYVAREIRFGPVPSLVNSLPLRIQAGLPIVDAQVDHLSVHLLMDTGASSLILFGPPTPTSMKISAVQRPANTIGEFDRKQVWLNSVRLGPAEFGRKPAFLVKGRSEGGFDGLISPAELGLTKIAFDLDRGLVSFSR